MRRKDNSAGLIDMISTGLSFDDLGDLTKFKAVTATDPDATPSLPEHPIVQPGDLWALGDHRLICGDSTDAATVRKLLGAERPHLMVTDPPWGVEYRANWRNERLPESNRATGVVHNDLTIDWNAAWKLFPGDVAYVWCADKHAHIVGNSLYKEQFEIRNQIIWIKARFVLSQGHYHPGYEPCIYAVRKGKTAHWYVNMYETKEKGHGWQSTVWDDIVHLKSDTGHSTQKPIECMRRPIINNSQNGDAIYEPFCGSGTTLIAAEMEHRRCFAVELNPLYVYVAIVRWQNFTGRSATLNGETFAEVVQRRRNEPEQVVPRPAPVLIASPPPRPRFDPPPPKLYAVPAQPRAEFHHPFLEAHAATLSVAGSNRLTFDEWDYKTKATVGFDVETFVNCFIVCFKNFETGKKITFEQSERCDLDRASLRTVLDSNLLISFNGLTYDLPMIALALGGADNTKLKVASDRIVRGNLKPWDVERELGVRVPRFNHIDLMEPNPSVRQGLKMLHGRLHGRFMVDLPYDPDARLTREEMNVVTLYCFNDLDATEGLWRAMREPLELRTALSREYKVDLRSKSDSQIGETIVKRRVEAATGRQIGKGPGIEAGKRFRYVPPEFIKFETERLRVVLRDITAAEFVVDSSGKVEPPALLRDGLTIEIGAGRYTMGIGGLHSQEERRTLHSNDKHVLIDLDVASQYPSIIMKLGLYPKALGPAFLDVYGTILRERLAAKTSGDKIKADALKISTNGVYGKLGSPYSPLYSPELLIAVTLTGQLSVLMLIERTEAAGISVVSANTDGVVTHCPRNLEPRLDEIVAAWEIDTGFAVERTRYHSLYNRDVNTYLAVGETGKIKRKGPIADPWSEGDLRGQLSKNPQMTVCSEAVLRFVTDAEPIERTIRGASDPRGFVTVIRVTGGATWRGHALGRAIRFYWSTDGDPILADNGKRRVAKTEGAKPLLELTDTLPPDIDYERYVAEAQKIAVDIGAVGGEGGLIG